jgi:hypothetical protein
VGSTGAATSSATQSSAASANTIERVSHDTRPF